MHFLPVFPAKELSLGSSSFVRCPRRIVGDRTVPTKVYKTTSGMEDVNSPLFHQTKNTVLAGGGFQDNKSFVFCALSQNTQLHGGNPCRRAQ